MIALLAKTLAFSPLAWLRDTRRMRRRIAEFAPRQPAQPTNELIVVIIPWFGTAVPWFSMVTGIMLAAAGTRVSFVLDDLRFGAHALRFRFVIACLKIVLRPLNRIFGTLYLSSFDAHIAQRPPDDGWIARLAELDAIWTLRGETSQSGRREFVNRSIGQLARSAAAVRALLKQLPGQSILVPGGVYGSSGVWVHEARAENRRVCTFDSGGAGVTMVASDGVASQLQDIPRAYAMLKKDIASSGVREAVVAAAREEMTRRRNGTDRFSSQLRETQALGAQMNGAIVLALNSSWDSAALGLHAIFQSSAEWIVETVRFLLANTTSTVVVRQHPAERLEGARSTDDYGALLKMHFSGDSRLVFIAAADPVNSYDLMERAAAVVVYTSTIGIEAAAVGKVVITPSNSYYSDLGFVWKARDREAYHRHLRAAAAGSYLVTSDQRADAVVCYYLTQCCNWLVSPYSPEGFESWSQSALANLLENDGVRILLRSFSQNVPVAYLNHLAHNHMNEQAGQPGLANENAI